MGNSTCAASCTCSDSSPAPVPRCDSHHVPRQSPSRTPPVPVTYPAGFRHVPRRFPSCGPPVPSASSRHAARTGPACRKAVQAGWTRACNCQHRPAKRKKVLWFSFDSSGPWNCCTLWNQCTLLYIVACYCPFSGFPFGNPTTYQEVASVAEMCSV